MCKKDMISFNNKWEECTQKNLSSQQENRRWEKLEIKLSQFTPEEITKRRRTIIIKEKIKSDEILPILDSTLVMRRDTTPNIVPVSKAPPTKGSARKYIMLTPLNMMNQ